MWLRHLFDGKGAALALMAGVVEMEPEVSSAEVALLKGWDWWRSVGL